MKSCNLKSLKLSYQLKFKVCFLRKIIYSVQVLGGRGGGWFCRKLNIFQYLWEFDWFIRKWRNYSLLSKINILSCISTPRVYVDPNMDRFLRLFYRDSSEQVLTCFSSYQHDTFKWSHSLDAALCYFSYSHLSYS